MAPTEQIYDVATGETVVVAVNRIEISVISIPQSLRMAQVLVYLHNKGLLQQVEAAIANMGPVAQIRFQREVNCNRYDELVLGIQQLLGWSDAEMDTMFIEADSAPLT